MENYIFKSKRLGFRNWTEKDKASMGKINADPKVMEYFPAVASQQETNEFIERMKSQYLKNGFCYFAVDRLENNEFIGFIGIAEKDFEADFTPCVDIGWRLAKTAWGNGYATEGAKRCLDFAFTTLKLKSIHSMCPEVNRTSEKVMKKIGMKKVMQFNHPLLSNHKDLQACVLYKIVNQNE